MDATRAHRLRASLSRLSTVLADIGRASVERSGARCPHRDRKSRCQYPGDCRNQVAAGDGVVCGGDALLRWEGPEGPVESRQ